MDDIKELWEDLNEHHCEKSQHFKDFFESFSFEDRKEYFAKKADSGKLCIWIARQSDHKIAYLVASIADNIGEIDSMYVTLESRENGIGFTLMEKAMEWLKANDVKKTIIGVAAGNEAAFGFYEKFGFVPVNTKLQLLD